MEQASHTKLEMSLPVQPEMVLSEYGQPQPETRVQVVLAYDGNDAFQAATTIWRAVAEKLSNQFEFREYWFQFSALTEPAAVKRATNAAAEADIVFCCPNNPYVLPGPLQDWIRRWVTRRNQLDGALVVLLPIAGGTSLWQTPVETDLRETARVRGLAFFATEYEANPSHVEASLTTETAFVFGEGPDPIPVPQSHPELRHWGINE